MANTIIDEGTGVAMEYIQIIKNPPLRLVWIKSFANEIGGLTQGVSSRVKGIDMMYSPPIKIYLETGGRM